jgi:hypothetical protein
LALTAAHSTDLAVAEMKTNLAGFAVVAAIAASAGGCAFLPSVPGVNRSGNDITINAGEAGKVKLGDGQKIPDDWPSDVPIPRDAKVLSTVTAYGGANQKPSQSVIIQTTIKQEQLMKDYRSQLEAEGWTISSMTNFNQMTSISAEKSSKSRNLVALSVNYDEKEKLTTLNITVGEK